MGKINTITLQQPALDAARLGWFRFGMIGEKVVLTNDAGEWAMLEKPAFDHLLAGTLEEDHPQHGHLRRLGMIRDGVDLDGLADRIRRKRSYLGKGPHLHVVVTTLRCNQSCRYCHASRVPMTRTDTDMSVETARLVAERAMASTSPTITFEFQGGEPTLNKPAIQAIMDRSRELAAESKKQVVFSLVSNLTMMTTETAEWLIENDVLLCTSLDGPKDLHDANRPLTGGGPVYDDVMRWMKWFNERYIEMGRNPHYWHVDALMTTTRQTLSRWREVVDLYVDLGIKNIHLRPLNPYGFATNRWKEIGYSVEEYLDCYLQALDYMIELNLQGKHVMEGTAATILQKMLTPDDPNFVDIRSPCGAGTGQVAYDHDGGIFPCDEARMIAAQGDRMFHLGNLPDTDMNAVVNHPTIKALAVASLNDALPGCSSCWNAPFCGVCPMHAYSLEGDIFGQRTNSSLCKSYLAISTHLMGLLADDENRRIEGVLQRWTVQRPI